MTSKGTENVNFLLRSAEHFAELYVSAICAYVQLSKMFQITDLDYSPVQCNISLSCKDIRRSVYRPYICDLDFG